MTAITTPQRNDEIAAFSKPTGYVEYEARNNVRDLIAIYGIEGARLRIAELFSDEARRGAK